jgi:y4mF family transcriptional regulator
MTARSVRDLSAVVRGRRKELALNQAELATLAGVSRKWVYEFEAGKTTAELGFLLRVLDALQLDLEVAPRDRAESRADTTDLDELLDEHRRR